MLPLDGFRPIHTRYNRPIPVPTTDPGAIPGSSVTLSCEWWAYLIGVCKHLMDQGIWDTNDQTVMSTTIARVYDLLNILAVASNTGDCETVGIGCDYDFTASDANPWVSYPTPTTPQSAWSAIGLGWTGANSTDNPEFWSEVAINADYIPFTLDTLSVDYGGSPFHCCGEDWAIRLYDHDLNLLAEVADSGASTVSFAGPLANVCRIVAHRRSDSFAGTLQPTITGIVLTGTALPGACEQLVPLADPPHRPPFVACFDFTSSDCGWVPVMLGANAVAEYHAGEGWGQGSICGSISGGDYLWINSPVLGTGVIMHSLTLEVAPAMSITDTDVEVDHGQPGLAIIGSAQTINQTLYTFPLFDTVLDNLAVYCGPAHGGYQCEDYRIVRITITGEGDNPFVTSNC